MAARVEDDDKVPASSESYPTVSIADASANEGNASGDILFEVSLSEPADRLAAVDFRTVPGGTATVGADYRDEWYTVFIPAGRTSVLAGVQIFDDDIDDDGETLIVEISKCAIGNLDRRSAAAPRYRNVSRDRHHPQLRSLAERLARSFRAHGGGAGSGGGRNADAGAAGGGCRADAGGPAGRRRGSAARACRSAGGGEARPTGCASRGDIDRMHGLSGRAATGRETPDRVVLRPRRRDAGDRLLHALGPRRSHATSTAARAGFRSTAKWQAACLARTGRGVPLRPGWWSHAAAARAATRGEAGSGATTSSLTGVYPWGGYALSERLSVWGVAGYGEGRLTLTPEGQAPIETDLDLAMAAAGLRGVLVEAPEAGGIELALKSDAMAVRAGSARARGLEAEEAGATRLRLGLESSLPLTLRGRGEPHAIGRNRGASRRWRRRDRLWGRDRRRPRLVRPPQRPLCRASRARAC